jgi:TRAP-type mannitol/chloroaromatic compound transport system substrate-binding protein
MKRRQLLKAALGGAVTAAAAGSGAAPALAQGRRELSMVTTWPRNFPGLGTSAERLARRITAASDGTLEVRIFGAGEKLAPFDSFAAVSRGEVDMYHAHEHYWVGQSPAFAFFAAVPFGLTATEMNAWIYWHGGQALWDELGAGHNIKPLLAGNTGAQMGGWFGREIAGLEDLNGLRFRIPGLGGEVLRRLGAEAVNLPGGEIFPALQSGKIDGTEWLGPWNDLAFGFHRVVRNYYYPGFHEPGTALALGLNKKLWDGLGESQRQIISHACAAENAITLAEFDTMNAAALEILTYRHGVQLRRLPNEVLRAMGRTSGEVVAEFGAGDPLSKRIYRSFIKARKAAIGWSKYGQRSFNEARALRFKYSD